MPFTVAPNTLRIPISLVRACVVYDTNPKSPKQEMNMANPEKILNNVNKRSSVL